MRSRLIPSISLSSFKKIVHYNKSAILSSRQHIDFVLAPVYSFKMWSPGPVFHRKATGDAALTVAAHTEPQDIILWAGWVRFCLIKYTKAAADI